MTKDEALDLALEALEESKTNNDTMEFHDRKNKAITAIKQARSAPVQEPKFVRMVDGVPCITLAEHKHLMATTPPAQPAPVQQKPLFADIIAKHPGLAEELKAMDAEPEKGQI